MRISSPKIDPDDPESNLKREGGSEESKQALRARSKLEEFGNEWKVFYEHLFFEPSFSLQSALEIGKGQLQVQIDPPCQNFP